MTCAVTFLQPTCQARASVGYREHPTSWENNPEGGASYRTPTLTSRVNLLMATHAIFTLVRLVCGLELSTGLALMVISVEVPQGWDPGWISNFQLELSLLKHCLLWGLFQLEHLLFSPC
jgi:hypothetical protein